MATDGMIELEGRDGILHSFRPAAFVPMDEENYLVLIEDKLNEYGEENILFARLTEEDGESAFEIIEDGTLIRKLYRKYCQAMEN